MINEDFLRRESGITLITLMITVIILTIITTTIALNIGNSTDVSNLTKLQNDIQALNSRIAAYYVKNDALPVRNETFTKSEIQSIVGEVSPNDEDTYYTIDLSKLDNLLLNFGTGYNAVDSLDKYVINEESHMIYFLYGIESGNITYYTIQNDTDILLKHTVPDGFQQVQYLITTGTQYIDIGYKIHDNERFEGKIYTSEKNKEMAVIGTAEDQSALEIGINTSGSFFNWSSGSEKSTKSANTSTLFDKELTFSAGINSQAPYREIQLDIDGGKYFSGGTSSLGTTNKTIRLFKIGSVAPFIGRVYYIRIYDNDEVVRNFLPCYRRSDGVVGMYDTVGGVFYTNSGTGSFTKGPDIGKNNTSTQSSSIYAILLNDGTLVFNTTGKLGVKYDEEDIEKVYEDIQSFTTQNSIPWKNDGKYSSITTVDFEDVIHPTSTAYWFDSCSNLEKIKNINKLDTSNVVDMTNMFINCSALTNLDLSSFNTSSVNSMLNMFSGCSSLTSLDLSSFNTNNVSNMYFMFSYCGSLETIYVGDNWNTNAVTESSYMFYVCTSLVGQNGTTYNSSYTDKTYARVDIYGQPGYLTYKLPAEYQQVAYIKLDQTNPHLTYINTQIPISEISMITCKYGYENFNSTRG